MMNRTDSFNIRRLFFSVAAAPFLLLLLLGVIDVSWHRLLGQQLAEVLCRQTAFSVAVKPVDSACQK